MSIAFPVRVMKTIISWNVYLSDPQAEDKLSFICRYGKGYDKLFHVRPLIDQLQTACQSLYHPQRELAVDERMVATKEKTGFL